MNKCEKILVERGLSEGRFAATRGRSTRALIRMYLEDLRSMRNPAPWGKYCVPALYYSPNNFYTDSLIRAKREARAAYLQGFSGECVASVRDSITQIVLVQY